MFTICRVIFCKIFLRQNIWRYFQPADITSDDFNNSLNKHRQPIESNEAASRKI